MPVHRSDREPACAPPADSRRHNWSISFLLIARPGSHAPTAPAAAPRATPTAPPSAQPKADAAPIAAAAPAAPKRPPIRTGLVRMMLIVGAVRSRVARHAGPSSVEVRSGGRESLANLLPPRPLSPAICHYIAFQFSFDTLVPLHPTSDRSSRRRRLGPIARLDRGPHAPPDLLGVEDLVARLPTADPSQGARRPLRRGPPPTPRSRRSPRG